MEFGLIMRAYAPFKTFGGAFHGDGRGPTTASNVTSRVKAWVTFNVSAGKVGKPNAKSDQSRWVWGGEPATAIPNVHVNAVKLGKNWMHFRLVAAGKNPLVPSADIDFRIAMTASIAKGHLGVNAELSGDQFPNVEVMLQIERAIAA